MKRVTIGVVGNPNCGKTTLFNALTGAKQRVGNWPGVTVERKIGYYRHGDREIEVVDLPGIYSLSAMSVDEQVARDYIISGEADLIVNIVDASNIERNLYLTTQLLEMQVPMLLALNMMDVAREQKIKINVKGLQERLGCPVVPIVASREQGIDELKAAILRAAQDGSVPSSRVTYAPEVEDALQALIPSLETALGNQAISPRWAAIKLIEGDEMDWFLPEGSLDKVLPSLRERIEKQTGEEPDIVIADNRYGFVSALTRETVKKTNRIHRTLSDKIDSVVLHRILGIPIFLLAMYLMFLFAINLGGAFIDFFDIAAGTIFVDGLAHLLALVGAPDWLTTILANGIGGGIQTIATFIPPIGFMFLALAFLEDSGYMARAAFVMDRFMRFVGLPGKSFVPMLVGFGCNVPAIMATRTLENERDRLLTIMMNPFMSCGARLPVYALFAAAFFPAGGQNLVFGLYLTGIAFAIVTGLVLKNTLLRGEITPFIMELPPYHMPTVKGVLLTAWDRLTSFMFRAGKVIIPVVMVLSFLNSMGTDGTFGNDDSENSVLAAIGQKITTVFQPMGIKSENWPATVGIFTGVFAKEAVVGTLDALYSQMDADAEGKEEAAGEVGFDFTTGMKDAFASVSSNLSGMAGALLDPLGISIGDVASPEAAAEEQEVDVETFGSMTRLFDGKVGAFAYLLFILLYFPCVAAIAAVYRETNLKWTLFVGAWTTGLAYMAATVFYQLATFSRHPVFSMSWIAVMVVAFSLIVMIMRRLGQAKAPARAPLTPVKV